MNLEQFRLTNKIKISSFKHRGNEVAIADELKLPLDLVKKYVHRLRKKDERDVSSLIASNLMTILMEGHQTRTHFLYEMLDFLEGKHKEVVSDCCSFMSTIVDGKRMCKKCEKECGVKDLDKLAIYSLKIDLIKELREESVALVDFAEKMGYTNVLPPAPVYQDNRIQVNMGGVPEGDPKHMEELSKLTPMEREVLRRQFEEEGRKQIREGIIRGEEKESKATNAIKSNGAIISSIPEGSSSAH